MQLTYIKNIKTFKPSLTVFSKLMHYTLFVKDKRDQLNTYLHSAKILNTVNKCVNKDNEHLFNDLFLFYLIATSHYTYKGNNPYKDYCDIIEKVSSKNKNEAIYYYSKFISFYATHNRPNLAPNSSYLQVESHVPWSNNYYGIFLELMNGFNKPLFINFELYRKKLSAKYEKYNNYYYVGTAALSLAASYSVIINDYPKFIKMAEYIVNNVDTIYEKMETNGLIPEDTKTLPEVKENIDINKYVEYMLEILQNKDEVKRQIY